MALTKSRLESFVAIAALCVAAASGCAVMRPGCGCAIGSACGAEVGCGCEPGCAAEPGCGCGSVCGGGRAWAGKLWCGDGGCEGGCGPVKPLINVCTGPGCGGGCEPGCGCEASCGCEVGCGVEPGCGCAVGCGGTCGAGRCGCGVLQAVGFGLHAIGTEVGNLLRPIGAPLGLCCPCGSGCCGGCGDFYWHEWHSDPPRCCDPCDDCGNWVGPSDTRGMRAPYDHAFAPRRMATLPATETMVR